MSKQTKLDARERVSQLLKAALAVSCEVGYMKVTRAQIAQRVGVASSLVPYHLGTAAQMRRAIMREALRVECLPVIAQGLAARDRHALKAEPELRARALQSLAS